MMSVLLLSVALGGTPMAPVAPVSPAAALNGEGFQLYKAKKYAEAIEKFRAAIAADSNHALSHYNLACTLGLMRKQKRTCEFDAYQSTVLDELEAAVKLDEGRRKRMQSDGDLESIRDTIRYQRLLGKDPARPSDGRALLVAVTWLGPAPGAFGNMAELDFTPAGTFTLSRKVMTDDGELKVEKYKGTFSVTGSDVTLKLGAPLEGKKTLGGKLGADGKLTLDVLGELTDQRSECEA
jgi:tetratricopeptide (TPR) repeat protein